MYIKPMIQNQNNYQILKKENKMFVINERDIKSGRRERRGRDREKGI